MSAQIEPLQLWCARSGLSLRIAETASLIRPAVAAREVFTLNIYDGSENGKPIVMPPYIFGTETMGRFAHAPLSGSRLLRDESLFPVACLGHRCLNILIPLLSWTLEDQQTLLMLILDRGISLLDGEEEDLAFAKEKAVRNATRYLMAICPEDAVSLKREMRGTLSRELATAVHPPEDDLFSMARAIWASDESLGVLETLEDELLAIQGLEEVIHVECKDNYLSVETHCIKCCHPESGEMHVIGPMAIRIYLDGSNGIIKWFNMDVPMESPLGYLQAPNVLGSGDAMSELVATAAVDHIGSYSLLELTEFAIRYVTYAVDDFAEYVSFWPVE